MAIRWISGKRKPLPGANPRPSVPTPMEIPLAAQPDTESAPAEAPTDPDRDLVRQAKAGDREAFNHLVLRYQDSVFNLAFRLIGNRAQAEEAAQEAFLRTYQSLASFKENASFYTWLFRIAINAAYSKGRTMKRLDKERPMGSSTEEGPEDRPPSGIEAMPDQGATPVHISLQDERASTVQEAIKSLEPDFRNVVLLRDIEGKAYEEIAQILDCPAGTVRSRLHRARLELRNRLQHLMEQE
ncbi:MAG: sigma-70 family RNA polymerase sigma factor [Planctomycetota bacterium]